MNNKRYILRTPPIKHNQRWETINVGISGKVLLRSVKKEIIAKMPSTTTTFIEVNPVNSFFGRMRNFIQKRI